MLGKLREHVTTHVVVVRDPHETLMCDRRSHAVKPQLLVESARRDERGSRDLLGVQAKLDFLRRVLTDGENLGDRFRRERVAESNLCHARCGC